MQTFAESCQGINAAALGGLIKLHLCIKASGKPNHFLKAVDRLNPQTQCRGLYPADQQMKAIGAKIRGRNEFGKCIFWHGAPIVTQEASPAKCR